jgi:hypothetical protein
LSQDRIDKLNELGFEIIVENNLANEEHIAKKSKTHHNKSAETKKRNTDEKCKQLAKQIVDIAGEKASELLEGSITEHRLKLLLGERFSELEKLPSHPNLYRLRAPIEWEVDLLDCERQPAARARGGEVHGKVRDP